MNKFRLNSISTLITVLSALFVCAAIAAEKPVQHLIVADITSFEEAKKVFAETTSELASKTKLDAGELHDIHMITYSLEKAVAYFVEHSNGDRQVSAETMAEVVELVHLGSENNRKAETEVYLAEYFKLADAFSTGL